MSWSPKVHPLITAYDSYVASHGNCKGNPWINSNLKIPVGRDKISHLTPEYRAAVVSLVNSLANTKCLLKGNLKLSLNAIPLLAEYREQWANDPVDYSAVSYNPLKCLQGLIQHCMFKYTLSSMWLNLWMRDYSSHENLWDKTSVTWSLQLGAGMSAKKLALPLDLSAAERHYFVNAKDYKVGEALRVGQLKALKFSQAAINEILRSPIGNVFEYFKADQTREPFIKEFLSFLAKQDMLAVDKIRTILDYVLNQRQNDAKYSLKGRTATSVLRQAEYWHDALAKVKTRSTATWDGIENVVPYTQTVQAGDLKIVELTTTKQLLKEGTSMRHCVYSYAPACVERKCAIFSLRISDKSYATIELRLPVKSIVQVRGSCNNKVDMHVKNHILVWAQQNNFIANF